VKRGVAMIGKTERKAVYLGGQNGLLPRADKNRFQPPVSVREGTGSGPEQMHHQASFKTSHNKSARHGPLK